MDSSPGSIAILTQYFSPEIGAPQNRLLELCKSLNSKGWKVIVITAMPNYPKGKIFDEYKGKNFHCEFIQGLEVWRYPIFPSNSRKAIPRIFSMFSFSMSSMLSVFKLSKRKPTHLLVESPPLTLTVSAYILCRLLRSKFVVNISDIWPLSAVELGALRHGSTMYRVLRNLEKWIYKKADLLCGQSDEIVEHMKKSNATHPFLFRNGVDDDRFRNHIKIKKADQHPLKLVYAGLLGVAQGLSKIIQKMNFKELNLELHLYGDGAERRSIEEFLTKNPDANVFLHDPVDRDSIPGLLVQHDGAFIPLVKHIYGAVPSKIYEAMAAGLPIVFISEGEGAKIIREHQLGWSSEMDDVEALKQNLKEFSQRDDLREKYRENGIRCSRDIFSRRIQLKNLHQKLLSL